MTSLYRFGHIKQVLGQDEFAEIQGLVFIMLFQTSNMHESYYSFFFFFFTVIIE